jgi:energy-coupling factor transporter transmembrane protein EcfT
MNNYLWLITAIFPPALYFAWSMTGHINLGVRHVLIIEPFVILLITFLFSRVLATKKVYLRLIIISLLVFQLYSVIKIFPNYIAYFNEFAGGPVNGYKILVDSNLDWGQDAKKLKKYMVENNIDHVCISYFGQASLEFYGIDYRYLPDNANIRNAPDLECVVAISMTSLYSRAREYGWLLKYQPTARIGYSINIYDFRQTQVEF